VETVRRIKHIAREIAKELHISGPFNIQFLAKDNAIKVIECNLRASRSFPFVSKILKINFIDLATKIMLFPDKTVEKPNKSEFELDYVGIKASQFSFTRLQKADPVLGVDMVSTGEVGCIGDNFDDTLLTAMLSVGYTIPKKHIMISSGEMKSKVELLDTCTLLYKKGFTLYATEGTHYFLKQNKIESILVGWPDEPNAPMNVMNMIAQKRFDLVINIPKDLSERELSNDYQIRRSAIDYAIPLITNARLARAFIKAFYKISEDQIQIKHWDEYK
jgi:carbamoyl-phosphate synthase large subunit